VIWPGSVAEVSRVLAFAHAQGLAVVPRGSGSALDVGRAPRRVDLVLDLTRLDRVLEHEPADVSITVETGMSLGALQKVLAPHRQRLPLDPPGWRGRTIGGVLASNSSGPLRTRYGAARDLLLGVRFVMADGSVVWGGSKVVKSVTGYDVPKLMVGAHGTLGVLVEAALRLHPEPWGERSWSIPFTEHVAAAPFVAAVFDSTIEATRVEVLNAAAWPGGSADDAIREPSLAVAVSIAGVDEAVTAQGERLAALAVAHGTSAREIDPAFWDRYAEPPARPDTALLRIACLAASTLDTLVAVETRARALGVRAAVSATAGVGAVRAALDGVDARRWLAPIVTELRDRLAGEGGSVVIERCPPGLESDVDVWGPIGEGELAVMRRLKQEFDPTGELNPGRFVGDL
jgi:glycolate oxidase FAD binding subunit